MTLFAKFASIAVLAASLAPFAANAQNAANSHAAQEIHQQGHGANGAYRGKFAVRQDSHSQPSYAERSSMTWSARASDASNNSRARTR